MKIRFLFVVLILGLIAACAEQPPAAEGTAADEAPSTEASPTRGQASAEIAGATIKVDYGRPALEGRDMLSRLPDGEVWRLGMDAATSLETTAALAFGDATLDAGSYTLFVKKLSADNWHLLVNSQTGIWGTAYDAEHDVAEIPLEKPESSGSVERFTIQVNAVDGNAGELVFEWGELRLRAGFEVQAEG